MSTRFLSIACGLHVASPLLLACVSVLTQAQGHSGHRSADADASWAKLYATDCGAAMKHPCPPSTDGYENEFSGDARLIPLLRLALPQRESWWVNGYGGSAPVSSIVQEFIGVPNKLIVDDNRYVTATGCVPHDCMSTGMLWIDTGTIPATVIFVGEDLVVGGREGGAGYHLYLYTSRDLATYYAGKQHIGIFPPEFLKSLTQWHEASISKYDHQRILLVTTVWPNGRTRDQFWSDLIPASTAATRNTGVKP